MAGSHLPAASMTAPYVGPSVGPPGRVASFHLVREPVWRVPLVLARLGADRPRLHRVPGLCFFRVMGTSRGSTTSVSADLGRTAMFAVWEDEDALDDFLGRSPIAWRGIEQYVVRLRALGGHGRWRGVDVLDAMAPGRAGGPVAVLTRADVRFPRWAPFLRAGRPVSAAVQQAPGLLAVAGIGEAPVGRQATFSLWASAAAMEAFAYHDPAHQDVVRRARSDGWYGEELFARFEPYRSQGAWDGRDPLAEGWTTSGG